MKYRMRSGAGSTVSSPTRTRADLVRWLRSKDRNLTALRRAARTAIVMPSLFAFGMKVVANPAVATFAAFGSFALLLLAEFGGTLRERLASQVALGLTGAVLVAIGTAASQTPLVAALAMCAVAFVVLFAGVVSSVLAGATPALLLSFILPVATKAPLSQIPDRVAGWSLATAVSLGAITLLWPAPAHDPIRAQASATCRALGARLRSDVAYRRSGFDRAAAEAHNEAVIEADAAVAALHATFIGTPYRPTGLSTPARALVRLVDEITWLNTVVVKAGPRHKHIAVSEHALAVKSEAATVLLLVADILDRAVQDACVLRDAVTALKDALVAMESAATRELPVRRVSESLDSDVTIEVTTSLDPSFRAQELGFAVGQIAANVERTLLAEQRSWLDRVLGRQPAGLAGPFAAAYERASAHVERHSVWLHNSLRGALALGVAVFVANVSGVQHSFWVVLGALSILRSSALSTGQNMVRGLGGTVIGFVLGAALVEGIGTNKTVLWVLLPLAILLAGVAPTVISFAAGQAAFTITLLILFNIIAPTGWRVGLVRIEDVAIGGAVSLAVGILFWPRGAAAALRVALAEAYADSASYLDAAVRYGVSRCARHADACMEPAAEALTAAASARRLDDTFRTYLAERGAKPVPMAEVTGLLTGVAGVRLAADAVRDLWLHDDAREPGDREAARHELLSTVGALRHWFDRFAAGLTRGDQLPQPTQRDLAAAGRLVDAVRTDLSCDDGSASATAVRVIWTGDHLDAVHRQQKVLVDRAEAALERGGLAPAWRLRPAALDAVEPAATVEPTT